MELDSLLRLNRVIRVIGFDDAPFIRHARGNVAIASGTELCPISGVVCALTRFEGMVWGHVEQDGWDATDVILRLLVGRKFLPQLHVLLLDGIAFGGFNIVDLPKLSEQLNNLPCVAVMRRMPKLAAIEQAIYRLPQPEERLQLLRRAGTIHAHPPFFFQVYGANPNVMLSVLKRLTDCGNVPEALRLAHLIGAAVVKGESGSSA